MPVKNKKKPLRLYQYQWRRFEDKVQEEHQGTFCVGRNVYCLGGMFTWVHPHVSFYQNLRAFIKPKIFVLFYRNFTFQI